MIFAESLVFRPYVQSLIPFQFSITGVDGRLVCHTGSLLKFCLCLSVSKIKFEVSAGNGVPFTEVLRAKEELWKACKAPQSQSSFFKSHRSVRSGGVPEAEQRALLALGQFVLWSFL